jgi:lipid II isoglutaminyl synthase (glutamine-hydrolysing)
VGRPTPDLIASDLTLAGPDGSEMTLQRSGGEEAVRMHTVLPGLYNVYNILAAAAAAMQLGAPLASVAEAVASFAPAFGRAERIQVDRAEIQMLLVKNPAGFNEVLRTVLANGPLPVLLIAINDRIADGRDVSWLWDVDVEILAGQVARIVVTGLRAEDMAVRLRYAGVPEESIDVEHEYDQALRSALDLAVTRRLFILPTYTAMLAIRAVLERRGAVRGFWQA